MVDSVSVSVGGEVAAWVTDVLVVEESGSEREQAQGDAGAEALDGASAVGFEGELALAGPEHRFDPLAHGAERSVTMGLVLAIGSEEPRAKGGDVLLEVGAGEAFIGHDGVAMKVDAVEHLGRYDALGDVGGGELEADRHAVRGAQDVEPKPPEVATVALAPAIGRVAGQLAAPRGLARLSARHRGAVHEPEVVAERRAADGQVADDPGDRRGERAQPF